VALGVLDYAPGGACGHLAVAYADAHEKGT